MAYDPLQERSDADRRYVESRAQLEAEDKRLRDEYRRIEQSDPSEELKARVTKWVAAQAAAARDELRAAVNGPEFEARLAEMVPPVLCALLPEEVEKSIAAKIVPDHSEKRRQLAELQRRLDDIEHRQRLLYEGHRSATAPIR